VSNFFQGKPNIWDAEQTFFALYAADTWKTTPKLTLNYGIRWEPYLPQSIPSGAIYTFDYNRFKQGLKTTVYKNAPARFGLSRRFRIPPGLNGVHNQWAHFAPRLGLAWDVNGDGRTSVRASYAFSYAFVSGEWRDTYNGHPPFGHPLTLQNPAGGLTIRGWAIPVGIHSRTSSTRMSSIRPAVSS
jgi:outer membrane receptor protein involved in Fe transport